MGQQGIVNVTAVVDFGAGRQVCDPWVESRGWLEEDHAKPIEDEIVRLVAEAIDAELKNPDWDRESLLRKVRRAAGTTVNQRSRRRPIIMPVVIDT